MAEADEIKKYFHDKAQAWLNHAYVNTGYNYPTAPHRNRIALGSIAEFLGTQTVKMIDLGCGDGSLCIGAAELGHDAVGIDQSAAMLEAAQSQLATASKSAQANVEFIQSKFEDLDPVLEHDSADVLCAMGFIGYLPDDAGFFAQARRILRPDGLLIVSCRNRLLNMTSISQNTRREIETGAALSLIDELEALYDGVPETAGLAFVERMRAACAALSVDSRKPASEVQNSDPASGGLSIEARQHTPSGLDEIAGGHGFGLLSRYGVHPHLIAPKLNKLLPPGVFNDLSDALLAFERLPVSLVWSSIFVSIYRLAKIPN